MKRLAFPLALLAAAPFAAWGAAPESEAVEFYNKQLNHYFITATASEAKYIDDGNAGPAWVRTGRSFQAWLSAASAPADAAGVCRFYSSAANSHFYTASAQECQLLKDQEAAERRSSGTVRGWSYEGIAFQIQPPTNGQCPAGTAPFSRVYNNGFTTGEGSNHRFVDDGTLRDLMVDRSWVAEGVVLCAVTKSTGTSANLPPTTTNFSSLAATWSGSAKWNTPGAGQQTHTTAPLELVITSDGTVTGSGNGCTFAGQVQSGDGFRSLFSGAVTATGCTNAGFNGAYSGFLLERYDLGTLAVHLKKGNGASEASINAVLANGTPATPPPGSTPSDAGITGDWSGTVGWIALRRQGGTETTVVSSNRPLALTISGTGALTGSGYGCSFTGTLSSSAVPGVFAGSISAAGCTEEAFTGTYADAKVRRDDGKLEVDFEKESTAGGVTTKATVEGKLTSTSTVPPPPPSPPTPGIAGSYKGSFTAHIQIRDRTNGNNVTTNTMVDSTLTITIAEDGAFTGTGFGCAFSGPLSPRNLPERIFTGTIKATGCTVAAMNGSYSVSAHTEGNGTLQIEMDLDAEVGAVHTSVRINGPAPRTGA